jgi:O-antigen/teichoic acid export membrane protein
LISLPIVLLGMHMRELLLSYALVAVLVMVYLHGSLRKVGITGLRFQRATLGPLLSIGTPFVFFSLAMVVLPNVNVMFLNELVPPEVIGAYSVSQRLIGFVIFPAAALIGALYPTLCRLHLEDQAEFAAVSRSALYGVALLAIPAAVGCGLFPELGVGIFGGEKYTAANDHLRVMSVFVFLVYFSMPLGTLILAAGRQKLWALVQCICIVVAAIGNPLLVPWFQARTGNGALGTCVSLVVAELFIVGIGIALSPRAIFDRGLGKCLLLSLAAGAVMTLVGYVTKPISLFLAVPAALAAYGLTAWFSGAVQPSTVDMVKGFVRRKLSRRR